MISHIALLQRVEPGTTLKVEKTVATSTVTTVEVLLLSPINVSIGIVDDRLTQR